MPPLRKGYGAMNIELKKPCNQCPFRLKAVAGWLGPWRPEEIVEHLPYGEFPCHCTIKGPNMASDDPRLKSCAGAAMFLNNQMQLSRAPNLMMHQQLLRDLPEAKTVFASAKEFLDWHNASPVKSWTFGGQS